MAENLLLLKRSSPDVPYGFTIRHIAFYSPKEDTGKPNAEKCSPLCALLVLRVDASSAAADAGLQPGHRIIELNGHCVANLTYSDICRITQRGLELEVMVVTAVHSKASLMKFLHDDPLSSPSSSSVADMGGDASAAGRYGDFGTVQGTHLSFVKGRAAAAAKLHHHSAVTMPYCPGASVYATSGYGSSVTTASVTSLDSSSHTSLALKRNDYSEHSSTLPERTHFQNNPNYRHNLRHSNSAACQLGTLSERYEMKPDIIIAPRIVHCEHVGHMSGEHIVSPLSSSSALDVRKVHEAEVWDAEPYSRLRSRSPFKRVKAVFNEMSRSFTATSSASKPKNNYLRVAPARQRRSNASTDSSLSRPKESVGNVFDNGRCDEVFPGQHPEQNGSCDTSTNFSPPEKFFERLATRQASFIAAISGSHNDDSTTWAPDSRLSASTYDLPSNNSSKIPSSRQSVDGATFSQVLNKRSNEAASPAAYRSHIRHASDSSQMKSHPSPSRHSSYYVTPRNNCHDDLHRDTSFAEGRMVEKRLIVAAYVASNNNKNPSGHRGNENTNSSQPLYATANGSVRGEGGTTQKGTLAKKLSHLQRSPKYLHASTGFLPATAIEDTDAIWKKRLARAVSVEAFSKHGISHLFSDIQGNVRTAQDRQQRLRPRSSCMMATGSGSPVSISDDSIVSGNASSNVRRTVSEQVADQAYPTRAETSSTFCAHNNNASASVHVPAATHRIQRFINFFSNDHQGKHWEATITSSAIRFPSRRHLKRSTTTTEQPLSPASTSVRIANVRKQGQIMHQEVAMGESLRNDRHKWTTCWAVLHDTKLYLCQQLSSYISDETHEKILNIPSDAREIDLKSAIVDIAYEYLRQKDNKKAHVFRVVTQQHTEHHFQVDCESEMLKWIESIRISSSALVSSRSDHGTATGRVSSATVDRPAATKSNSADSVFLDKFQQQPQSACARLHSDREYELPNVEGLSVSSSRSDLAHLLSKVTLASTGPFNDDGSSTSASTIDGPSVQATNDATTKLIMQRYKIKSTHYQSPNISKRHHSTESPLEHSMQPGTSTDSGTGIIEGAVTSNGDQGAITSTPKTVRKWKKSKAMKQGSSSSSGRSDRMPPQHSSAIGQKIVDYPTGGDGDMVPLLIRLCVRVVEAHGMDTVGIYRIPGNTAAVNALKENLSSGFENIDIGDSRWKDVNVVSSLLKMFLRKLPEPLLTDKLYPFFIDANRIASHPQRLRKLRYLVRKLPSAHYETLKYLMGHLRAVVEHSSVNKMETRNLALMFGPSIVRPSDNNMATMVTHMSDQCKIIETFITYYDWMFDEGSTAEDEVPVQVLTSSDSAAAAGGASSSGVTLGIENDPGIMTTSFNDMHNLIRRVNEAEAIAMMDAQKGGKIKQILNVRRNSKREKRKKERDHSVQQAGGAPPACAPSSVGSAGTPSSATSIFEHSFSGAYQERDIDAEIASRQQQTPIKTVQHYAATSSSADHSDHSPSLDSSHDSVPETGIQPIYSHLNEMKSESAREAQKYSEADEMRRRRQKEMYSARRIFIAGTDADLDDDADLSDLVSHTRHLNLASSPTLDVLSAETREKIRRLQQLQGWASTALERRDAEVARRKRSPVSRTNEEVRPATVTKATAEDFSSTDALSLTSDYSTTSSAPLTVPVTVSCVDHLVAASSDYASSDVSPCTRNASASPRHPDLEAAEITRLNLSSRELDISERSHHAATSSGNEDRYVSSRSRGGAAPETPSPSRCSPISHKKRSESQPKLHRSHVAFSGSEVNTAPASSSVPQDGSTVKARTKVSSRRESWRRHTLSDVDIIQQAVREAKRKSSVPSASQAGAHSDIAAKMNKFARWVKNSFRRSSAIFFEGAEGSTGNSGTHKKTAIIVAGITTPTDGSTSSSNESNDGVTPPSEVVPSSGDEQL